MNYLKSYKLFESTDVVMAGIENAMSNKNLELFKELIEQHDDLIDYDEIISWLIHLDEDSEDNYRIECDYDYDSEESVTNMELLLFLKYVPSRHLDHITSIVAHDQGLTSLEGLSNMKHLEFIDCSYNDITTLEHITDLPNLTHLCCGENPLPQEVIDMDNDIQAIKNYYRNR